MTCTRLILTICILLLSNHSILLSQELRFQRETDTIPVFINGVPVHSPFAGSVRVSSKPTFADVDGDGDFDLFVGTSRGNINFYCNTGTATNPIFTLETENFESIDVGINSAPTFADIDNDADFDLFVGEFVGNINFYKNTGTVTNPIFTFVTSSFAPSVIDSYSAPTLTDIDNDGDFDLFVGGFVGDINFYRNTGTVTNPIFVLETESFASIIVGDRSTPTFVDIDNDGDFDLFVGELDGKINFYRNTGTATNPIFVLETENFASIDVGEFSVPNFVDIDNDADFDLFAGELDGHINFYRNTGTATNPIFTLGAENLVPISIDIGFNSIPAFADIDNDGDFDLFLGGQDGNINFYRNTGTTSEPNFTLETENFFDIRVEEDSVPTFADIDNDGDFDLFVGEEDGNINFYRNTGTATDPIFALETEDFGSINVGGFGNSVPTFVDIDNDRDFDLFVGEGDGNINFYRNTGTTSEPNFTLETENFASIDVKFGSSVPTFADIDDDGDFDLFVGGQVGNINFYPNTGTAANPIFVLETEDFASIDVGEFSTPIFTDIDNDGDFDLFVGQGFGGLHFYRNITPIRGDINNDGEVDVDDLIRVIEIILGTPPEPTDEENVAADVNGDGKVDVKDLIVMINIILGIG